MNEILRSASSLSILVFAITSMLSAGLSSMGMILLGAAPVMHPTLETGVDPLVVAALAWLAKRDVETRAETGA